MELVDKQVGEALLEGTPRGRVAGEEVAHAAEQVGEVEKPEAHLHVPSPPRERVGDGHRQPGHVLGICVAQVGDDGDRGLVPRLQFVLAAGSRVPVALGAAGRRGLGVGGQGVERRRQSVVVDGRLRAERLAVLYEFHGGGEALVGRVAARLYAESAQARERRRESCEPGDEVGFAGRLRRRIEIVTLAEDALRADGELAHGVESHADAQQAREPVAHAPLGIVDGLLGRIRGGQPGEPLLPQTGAFDVGAELVELLEGGVDGGLHRELAQQAPGKTVDGADRRVVERREGAFDQVRRGGACLGRSRPRLEFLAHALAQFAGGLLGEGDGGHAAHVAGAQPLIEHAVDVAVDEHARLAGASPGLEQEGGAEVARDKVTHVLIADRALRRWHRRLPPGDHCAAGSRGLQVTRAPACGRESSR